MKALIVVAGLAVLSVIGVFCLTRGAVFLFEVADSYRYRRMEKLRRFE